MTYKPFDYQSICNIDTPQSERRKLRIGDFWSNSARCKSCHATIRSVNRHDYVECPCGELAVDGGSWYLKRLSKTGDYIELSEKFNDIHEVELT